MITIFITDTGSISDTASHEIERTEIQDTTKEDDVTGTSRKNMSGKRVGNSEKLISDN